MNSAHLHLILNHIPVFTTLFGLILVAVSRLGARPAVLRIALYTLVAGAVFAVPSYLTGEPAEEVIEHVAGITPGSVDAHEDIAGFALASSVLLGVYSVTMLFWLRGKPVMARSFVVGLLALAAVSSSLFVVTAYMGGQIHHTEIATATGSSTQHPSQADED